MSKWNGIERSPLKRSTTPLSRSRITPKKRKPARKVNAERKRREFARAYGSKARVEFVQSLLCVACEMFGPISVFSVWMPIQNAHTEGGGGSRKADANTIVPCCATHHKRYDEHKRPLDTEDARDAMKLAAVRVEALWQSFAARGAA